MVLRKVGESITLFLFIVDLIVLRFSYNAGCFSISSYSGDAYRDLILVCVVQFAVDLVSSVAMYRILFLRLRPAFPFSKVLRPLRHQLYIVAVMCWAHGLFVSLQGLEGW
jgi:hypothetical protein